MATSPTLRKRLSQLGFALTAWFFIHQIIIISDGLIDEEHRSEVAVIFGNTVNKDGSLSPRLKARLDNAIELYNS